MRQLKRFSPLILFFILGSTVLGAAGKALAQAPGSSQTPTVEERLGTIEQLLQNLEKRLEALEGSPIAKTAAAPSLEGPEGNLQTAALGSRIEALDQELRIVQRKRELETEAAAALDKRAPLVGVGADGFSLRSPDNEFSLNLRSSIQADGRFFSNGAPQPGGSTFVPYKVRLYFDGVVFKNFSFRLMPDFGNGLTTVQDAYVDAAIRPWLKLRAGKTKGPVGLERLVTDTDVEFYERALPTNLAPNRDVGYELWGEPWGGVVSFAGGIFNGVADGSSADLNSDNHHEFEGRLFAHPFRKTSLAPIQGFGLGLAGTSGRETGTVANPTVAGYKTSSQLYFFQYRSDGAPAGTVVAAGDHWRISPQAYYYWGPFGAWAEYIFSSQDVKRGATLGTLHNAAWQVAATYLLTGEKASYRTVSPAHSLDLRRGYWGAFEVTARFSELRVDQSAFPVFADPLSSVLGAKSRTLGLNWYLNKNTKFVFNFEQTDFMQIAGGMKRKQENAFLERLQLAF
jgi:phosphate-selective porin OprO/OprP